jgi:nucleotide-binding universal stress UspA family protein
MCLPRRILCPTDFSPSSERALVHALAWSRHAGAELHVLHVVVESDEGREARPYAGVLDARAALEESIARAGAAAEACRAVTRAPSVSRSIFDHALEAGIDLVVMGTHGRRGFRAPAIGDQTEAVVRAAPCPVLAVPAGPGPAVSAPPKRILVPLDFGPRALPVLRYAQGIAHSTGGSLLLLHVIEEPIVPDVDYPLGRSIFLREPVARRRSSSGLERLFWQAGGPDVPFDVRVVDGRAATEIARIAAETAADAVLMPTHGLAAANRLVVGTTTDKVLRRAPCPVLAHCETRPRSEGSWLRESPARSTAAVG